MSHNFSCDIEDLRKVAFDETLGLSLKGKNRLRNDLLSHRECNNSDKRKVLICVDTDLSLKKMAFLSLIQEEDKNELQKILESIVQRLGRDDYIFQKCEKYLEKMLLTL